MTTLPTFLISACRGEEEECITTVKQEEEECITTLKQRTAAGEEEEGRGRGEGPRREGKTPATRHREG